MSLSDPEKKMSKSDENPNGAVLLLDDRDTILRKFKKAVTDSEASVRFDREQKPGVSNLMSIYSCVTGKSYEEIEAEFQGRGYGDFKAAVGETVADALSPVQKRYEELMQEKTWLDTCIKENAEKAAYVANKTLRKVKKKVGLNLP